MNYVLDACALIAFLRNESGADKVEVLLEKAKNGKANLYMNKLNLLEVYYDVYRYAGKKRASDELFGIQCLPIEIVAELSDDVFIKAGEIKATCRLSLADAVALAEAIARNAELVTADHLEMDKLHGGGWVRVCWIR